MTTSIRTRFAPSPTGYVHLGSVRTALYCYLFAKANKGSYVLRVEDTDQTRKVEGSIENLVKVMAELGLNHDEGPGQGGDYGPYFQSERLGIYQREIQVLLDKEVAYPCFCTSKRLGELRAKQQEEGLPPGYDGHCRSLDQSEARERMKSHTHVIRMKVPQSGEVVVRDLVKGEIRFDCESIDDQILMKSDGFPTYHFANVVDDHHMKISHVVRGDDWLTSTPKHILLYQAFDWELPEFAHLPNILNPDKTKLSKRQGDVAVEDYLKSGYLKEALLNYLAFLGWNPGTDQEIFSMDELIESFQFERVSKAGAVFDKEKLNWMNEQYLREVYSEQEYLDCTNAVLSQDQKETFTAEQTQRILLNLRKYLSKPEDVHNYWSLYTTKPQSFDWENESVQSFLSMETSPTLYEAFIEEIKESPKLDETSFREMIKTVQKSTKIKGKGLYMPLRVAITGITSGPEYFLFPDLVGKEGMLERLEIALEKAKEAQEA